jgi:hypothetical protein
VREGERGFGEGRGMTGGAQGGRRWRFQPPRVPRAGNGGSWAAEGRGRAGSTAGPRGGGASWAAEPTHEGERGGG